MIYAFKRRRFIQILGCAALAAMASLFLLMGSLAPADAGFLKWAFLTFAAAFYLMLIPILQETFTPGPILTIGPEGLTYQPFSLQPIPWEEVAAVKRVRAPPRRDRDEANPARDGIAFEVRDLSRIPLRRGFGGGAMTLARSMSGGGTQITMAQGSTEEIIAAIKAYWHGEIPIVTVTGRTYS